MNENVKEKINVTLFGMLSGVVLAAAFTYTFAIPANDYHWKMEIWNRGGAAWTFDVKSGHMDWKWLVEPLSDAPRAKRTAVPSSQTNIRTERL